MILSLQLAGGLLSFMVSRGSGRSTSLVLDQLQLSDGRWHDLQLELRDVRSGRDSRYVITLTLDFGLYQVRAACVRAQQQGWWQSAHVSPFCRAGYGGCRERTARPEGETSARGGSPGLWRGAERAEGLHTGESIAPSLPFPAGLLAGEVGAQP